MRRAAGLTALSALLLCAQPARARIVLVQTPEGPVYTNIPEPADGILVKPSKRAEAFRPIIRAAAERHGVPAALIEAVMACESNFDPQAVSRAGACGLMQLMPATARSYGLEDPFDPTGNVDAGARHLAGLLESFGGDRALAIAAYNAGEGAVRRSGGIPPFPETRRYVQKVKGYLSLLGEGEPSEPPAVERVARRDGRQSIRMGRDAEGRLVMTNAPDREGGSGR